MPEFDWINRYLRPLAQSAEAMQLANDVALLKPARAGHSMIVTMDTLVEGVHFLRNDPAETIGRKLLRVNVSDVLCKGAVPSQALLSLAIPPWFDEPEMAAFCEGLGHDLELWEVALVGGDIVSTEGPLVVTIALSAETKGRKPTDRSGARAGDGIYVTGIIGGGLVGLEEAKRGGAGPSLAHYRVPDIPPLACSRLVADFATASIDVSDGLLSEALHISSASKKSLHITLDRVPWAESWPDIDRMLELASGGDDFQVLLTVSPEDEYGLIESARESEIPIQRIGEVRTGQGVVLEKDGETVDLPAVRGFQHRNRK